ncbi:hypothetical protein VFPPC_16332 [Pochonia chlamydosporia 170]|uniref:Uncharacterized protein n=1 Tax=Pochonia chlamydosporia 170 TaxID=1380566 RepID=A0A179FIC8_METCM|nr:hypothetical protein VFPPC_16332 [Pochonia chlamydosporia 170]OAQ65316.1 hypothetical protein VFPPC_16332 [Pochonia chlamydosporia 170]
MQFSIAAILALASAAIAAPTAAGHHEGKWHHYCTDSLLNVDLDIDLDLDVNVLGLLRLDLDLDVDLDIEILRRKHPNCKAIYRCPTTCQKGKRIHDSCHKY